MVEQKIQIVIDKKGNFTLTALEGFAGESCMEKTRTLEVALGGLATDEGKTDAYYDGDDPQRVHIEGL